MGEFGESKDQTVSASAQRGQTSSTELDSNVGTQRQQRGHRAKPSSLQGRILAFIATPMAGARVTWETMKSSGRKSRCFSRMWKLGSSGAAESVTDASRDLPNLPAARNGSMDSFTYVRTFSRAEISESTVALLQTAGATGHSWR